MLRDVLFAARALRRTPVLLATAVLTLALGIGVSTGVFTVAYGLLMKPLPYAAPETLVAIGQHRPGQPDADVGVKLPEVDEWRRRTRAFAHIAGYAGGEFALRGVGETRSVRGAMVTDGFFDLLGVPPQEGSTIDVAGAHPVAVLTSKLADQFGRLGEWRTRGFTLGASHFSAAAIMPSAFTYPSDRFDLWLPAAAVPNISFFKNDDQRDFKLIARLGPGVTLAQARDDAARVSMELNEGLTEFRRRYAWVKPLDEDRRRQARTAMVPFAAGAVLVLVIACANVSGLLASRAAARRREFAVRRALGGETAQLLGAAFAESVTIALGGWVLGLVIAHLVVRAFVAFGAEALSGLQYARLDAVAVIASFFLCLLVGIVSGAAPALRALRTEAGAVLKQTTDRGARSGAARGALVVAQVALTIVLLVCAGLLTRTVTKIVNAERGFELQHASATRLLLGDGIRWNATDKVPIVDQLLSRIRALPGVTAAGIGSDLPPGGSQLMMTIRVTRENQSEVFPLNLSAVTPGYLEGIGVRLIAGRLFEERDLLEKVPSVVVTESGARRLFFGREAVGRKWPATLPTPAGRVQPTVIGVVRDVKYGGLDREAPAALFAPFGTLAPTQVFLVIRSNGDPMALAPDIRRVVQQLDPSLPVFPPKSLEEVVAASIADRRLRLQLSVVFAALALVLAAVALWGAIAQNVVDRRRELAIRMALGSTDGEAVSLVVRGGLLLIGIGVAAGVLGAALSARGLRHLLHGVTPLDPLTFVAGVAIALLVSVIACYVPARRAASISPSELLRDA